MKASQITASNVLNWNKYHLFIYYFLLNLYNLSNPIKSKGFYFSYPYTFKQTFDTFFYDDFYFKLLVNLKVSFDYTYKQITKLYKNFKIRNTSLRAVQIALRGFDNVFVDKSVKSKKVWKLGSYK